MDDITSARIDRTVDEVAAVAGDVMFDVASQMGQLDQSAVRAEVAEIGVPADANIAVATMMLGSVVGYIIGDLGGTAAHVEELIDAVAEFSVGDAYTIAIRQAEVCDDFIEGVHASEVAQCARLMRVAIAEIYFAMLDYELATNTIKITDPTSRMVIAVAATKFLAAYLGRVISAAGLPGGVIGGTTNL